MFACPNKQSTHLQQAVRWWSDNNKTQSIIQYTCKGATYGCWNLSHHTAALPGKNLAAWLCTHLVPALECCFPGSLGRYVLPLLLKLLQLLPPQHLPQPGGHTPAVQSQWQVMPMLGVEMLGFQLTAAAAVMSMAALMQLLFSAVPSNYTCHCLRQLHGSLCQLLLPSL